MAHEMTSQELRDLRLRCLGLALEDHRNKIGRALQAQGEDDLVKTAKSFEDYITSEKA